MRLEELPRQPVRLKHNYAAYRNRLCHCDTCREDHRLYIARRRAERGAERVLVEGRLVHPRATHGCASSYVNWGCRCVPCTSAHRENRRRWTR